MAVENREILQADCEALNAAFDELGFEWQWDPDLYASLATIAQELEDSAPPAENRDDEVEDDRLRLIFTCCHPALPPDAQKISRAPFSTACWQSRPTPRSLKLPGRLQRIELQPEPLAAGAVVRRCLNQGRIEMERC